MSKKIKKANLNEVLDSNGIPRITQELFYVITRDEMGLRKITIDIGLTVKDFTEKLESLQKTYKEMFANRSNGEQNGYSKEYNIELQNKSYNDMVKEEKN